MVRRKDDVAWSDPALLILGSLASGPKHGYAIVQDTEDTVGVTLGPGTLYAALSRLERAILPVASFTPTMFATLESRVMVSTEISTTLRPGIL